MRLSEEGKAATTIKGVEFPGKWDAYHKKVMHVLRSGGMGLTESPADEVVMWIFIA